MAMTKFLRLQSTQAEEFCHLRSVHFIKKNCKTKSEINKRFCHTTICGYTASFERVGVFKAPFWNGTCYPCKDMNVVGIIRTQNKFYFAHK